MPISTLTLREKKQALLKLKILNTFIEKLKTKPLEDISVKEIAKELDISEMTFFNYFKSKKEILTYYIELWSLEMQLLIENLDVKKAIYRIFEKSADIIEQNPNLFMEIASSMALKGISQKNIPISRAERIVYFGFDIKYKEGDFLTIIKTLLPQLKLDKEEENFIYTFLFNTFFATPVLVKKSNFSNLKKEYFKQLDFIFKEIK